MISREEVKNLVEIFYQPTFKTFYINSLDGTSFVKQVGVFVSLGITTSMKVLEDIRNVINASNEYTAVLAEISSRKINGQYCNALVNIDNNPEQYKLVEFSDNIMNKEESIEELNRMKSLMNPEEDLDTLRKYAPKISKLSDLIDKLTNSNGWDAHMIQNENGDYRIFHQYVNYKKEGDVEYRIGIYVTDKN